MMSKQKDTSSTRRDFLRTVGATTASLSMSGLKQPLLAEEQPQKTAGHPVKHEHESLPTGSDIQYPRIFTGRQLARISFPLGGIGTGGIGLGGRGNLMDWEIFNRPDVGNSPAYAFPVIWAKLGNHAPVSRVLERRFLPPYDLKPDNLGSANVPGLPRLAEATFRGSFPTANIEFHDEALPVAVSLDASSSFQPLDADVSGLPIAILKYTVRNPGHEAAEVVIAWTLENPLGEGKQRQNEVRGVEGMRGLLMTDPSLTQDDPLKGSVVLAAIGEKGDQISVRPHLRDNGWNMGVQRFWFDTFSKTGDLGDEGEPHSAIGSVSIRQTIPPGERRTYRFLISWHLPNRTAARCGWDAPKGEENKLLGNYYCTRFDDAWPSHSMCSRIGNRIRHSLVCTGPPILDLAGGRHGTGDSQSFHAGFKYELPNCGWQLSWI
jgi:non-lysosomal glucosylceramidase